MLVRVGAVALRRAVFEPAGRCTARHYLSACLPYPAACRCPHPPHQNATEEGVRQEFGYDDLGRAFADMRVSLRRKAARMRRKATSGQQA